MEKFTAFDPKTEVIGYTMTSFLDCVTHTEVVPIVRAHGVENIDPDQWYPQQLWLDILTDIVHQPNAMENLVAVGMKLAEKIIFPPSVTTIKEALAGGSVAYQKNHRNGNPGYVTYEDAGPTRVLLTVNTPYPDDFMYGTRYGYARRFLGGHRDLRVHQSNRLVYRRPEDPPLVLEVQWS